MAKKSCPACGIGLPFAWKWCEEHDPQRRKNRKPVVKLDHSIDEYAGLKCTLTLREFLKVDTLVYDGDTVIGWK